MVQNKKINLASVSNLKTNCDEHLADVLSSDYKEDFTVIDIKLALTYLSILIAGLVFYLEKKFNNDFKNSLYFNLSMFLVIAFYICSLAGYLYSKFVGADIKFVGSDAQKNKLIVSTKVENHSPMYLMTLKLNEKKLEAACNFTKLYNKEGFLQLDAFKATITEQINILKRSKD